MIAQVHRLSGKPSEVVEAAIAVSKLLPDGGILVIRGTPCGADQFAAAYQWGTNAAHFPAITLPDGVTLDGEIFTYKKPTAKGSK